MGCINSLFLPNESSLLYLSKHKHIHVITLVLTFDESVELLYGSVALRCFDFRTYSDQGIQPSTITETITETGVCIKTSV